MIVGYAPMKIIIQGEHSVVYNKLGYTGSLGKRSKATVKKSSCDGISIFNHGFKDEKGILVDDIIRVYEKVDGIKNELKELTLKKELDEGDKKRKVGLIDTLIGMKKGDALALTKAMMGRILIDTPKDGFDLVMDSFETPCGTGGMGSGSSIAVASAGAVDYFLNGETNKQRVDEAAYLFDVLAHNGLCSGIDHKTILNGGFNTFIRTEGITPLGITDAMTIVIGDTMEEAMTAPMVKKVSEFRSSDIQAADRLLDEMDQCARRGLDSLKRGDMAGLGEEMNINQSLLEEIGVSHPKLELLVNAARDAGALGAKLSGGGGGGIMIALCENEQKQKKVSEAINNAGGKAIIAQLGVPGLTVREE